VWYDKKRACYSSNAPIMAAKQLHVDTLDASLQLLAVTATHLKEIGVEIVEYEEPKRGVLWRAIL
jgi:hypothetical protein